MTPEETTKQEIIQEIEEERQEFQQIVAGLHQSVATDPPTAAGYLA